MFLKRIFILSTISILSLSFLFAQAGRGTARVGGTVKDEEGKPVIGAKIILEHQEEKSVVRDAKTDKKGKWSIMGLGTGIWRLKVSAEGYEPFENDIFVSQLERNPSIDVVLKKSKPAEPEYEEGIEFLDEGNKLFNEKKFGEALSSYMKFLEKNPSAFQIHYNLGNCYKEMGEYDKAIEEYNIVISKLREKKQDLKGDELASKAFAGLGESFFKKGDYISAQENFKESLDINPKDEVLAYNVGEIYFSNGKVDEAIQFFNLSAQIKPDWSEPYLKLGYAYFNKGDFEKAKENLKKYLELAPNAPNAEEVKKVIEALEKKQK
jgi:tetratricopeptide (TPR) repeat protein